MTWTVTIEVFGRGRRHIDVLAFEHDPHGAWTAFNLLKDSFSGLVIRNDTGKKVLPYECKRLAKSFLRSEA